MWPKIIKDLAYNFIEIDKDIAQIIDHFSFQRLKNISQLTAHHLFPSANHTRFEHSLGVMHLAVRFSKALEKYWIKESFLTDSLHLKYASLLHDIGHAPMSHVGEQFYNKEEILDKLNQVIKTDEKALNNGAKHELMSCYVIAKNFREKLEEIFNNNSVKFDLDYFFRIITGSQYDDLTDPKFKYRNLIIDILNSKSIDIDKIDYLVRDNYMVGNVAPAFNLERLLYSIQINKNIHFSYSPVGISSLVSFIDCRDFLYLWVYNHHIVVYTDFLYRTAIEHLCKVKDDKSKNSISIKDYFSCEAISERLITDDNIRVLLNNEFATTNSDYSKRVLSQLLERRFLKPIWKTIFEFNEFLNGNFDDREIKQLFEIINNDDTIRAFVKELFEKCRLIPGEIFIIPRSNKFYAMSDADFYICINDQDVNLKRIMPERRFGDKYTNVAFYIFTTLDKLDAVKVETVKIIKARLATLK